MYQHAKTARGEKPSFLNGPLSLTIDSDFIDPTYVSGEPQR